MRVEALHQATREVERRQAERSGVRYLRCYSPIPATVQNLSLSGMCVETLTELELGRSYAFRLRHRGELLEIEGTIEWSLSRGDLPFSGDASFPLFWYGVAFTEKLAMRSVDVVSDCLLNELDVSKFPSARRSPRRIGHGSLK